MGRERILAYCLTELSQLSQANQLFATALGRMIAAASSPLLVETLEEQLDTNRRIALALLRVSHTLEHPVEWVTDDGALGLVGEAERVCVIPDEAIRDMAIALSAVRMDQWQAASFEGVASFLRQLLEDDAAGTVEGIVKLLGISDRHLDALRPSLTDLSHDEERHGHETRSPEDRSSSRLFR